MAQPTEEYVYELERQLLRTSNVLVKALEALQPDGDKVTTDDISRAIGMLESCYELIRNDEIMASSDEAPPERKRNFAEKFLP